MDPITAASLASTVVIFIGFASILISDANKIRRSAELVTLQFSIRAHETRILHEMGRECEEVLRNSPEPPKSVLEAFQTFRDREREWFTLMDSLKVGSQNRIFASFKSALKLQMLDEHQSLAFSLYKESILLLRDLCSALKTEQQLVTVGTIMARLLDEVGDDKENDTLSGEGNFGSHPATRKGKASAIRSQRAMRVMSMALEQIGQKEFVMNVTVAIERKANQGGHRFRYIHTEAQHAPGRLKLDSGSDFDLVSRDFLALAGVPVDSVVEIPPHERPDIEGFQGARYQPIFRTQLHWFREGDHRIQKTNFYVVDEAPFDLLLGSNRFVPEITELARSMIAIRPSRNKEMKKLELQKDERERQARILYETTLLQEELKKRKGQAHGQDSTSRSNTAENMAAADRSGDVELGRT